MNRILPILFLLLAGCTTRPVPPTTIYTLNPGIATGAPAAVSRRHSGPILKLAPIRGTRPFSTTRMLYSRHGFEQNSFAFSRWSDSPVALLQLLFIEGLNRSGLFKAVLPPATPFKSELALEGTLLDFSLHMDGAESAAVLDIRFLLLDNGSRKILATRLFHVRIPVAQANPATTAEALNRASRQVLRQLVQWLETEIAGHGLLQPESH
jgi:cholesterol transport system auxiliary component